MAKQNIPAWESLTFSVNSIRCVTVIPFESTWVHPHQVRFKTKQPTCWAVSALFLEQMWFSGLCTGVQMSPRPFNRPRGKPLLVHRRKKSWYKCRWILSCLATENTKKWNHKIMRFSIRLEKGSQSRVYIWTKYFPEWPLRQRWLCWKQTTRSREFFPWFLGTWAPLAILVHLHGKQVLSSEAWLSTRFHCNTDTAFKGTWTLVSRKIHSCMATMLSCRNVSLNSASSIGTAWAFDRHANLLAPSQTC